MESDEEAQAQVTRKGDEMNSSTPEMPEIENADKVSDEPEENEDMDGTESPPAASLVIDEENDVDNSQESENDGVVVSDDKVDDEGGGSFEEEQITEEAGMDIDEEEDGQEVDQNEDEDEEKGMTDHKEDDESEEVRDATIEEESGTSPSQESANNPSCTATRKRTLSESSGEDGPKRKMGKNVSGNQSTEDAKHEHDKFCWVCHKDEVKIMCKLCPRSYHTRCMTDYPNATIDQGGSSCPCPECVVVMTAETIEFRSDAMKQISLDQLMILLRNVCQRMRATPGSEPFLTPVDPVEAEDYDFFITYPMDMEKLEKNIKKRLYGSTEAFLADAQWLVHNSIIYNTVASPFTIQAKRLLKTCKAELNEIETCPECYLNANESIQSWFVQACRHPHLLVWAKLKGFPFWPAKAMKIKDNEVDVRFFGQHDRAWVAMKDCFLYSEEWPTPSSKKSAGLVSAIEELEQHIANLKEAHGPIQFFPAKTPMVAQLTSSNIQRMLPEYKPPEQSLKNQGQTTTSSSSSTVKTNANNNNNNKVPQPAKKSPMTIRISSLKTNPTIVTVPATTAGDTAASSSDNRVVTRLTRKSSAAAQQNQSTGLSESENSTDENQTAEANSTEEKAPESVPDDNAIETDEETPSTVPKGSEILANALGGPLRRSARGQSRSGDGSSTQAMESLTSTAPTPEKRLTRSALKVGSTADTGNETDDSSRQTTEDQPPDSVLEAMGLSKKTKDAPASMDKVEKPVQVKPELDSAPDTDGELNPDISLKSTSKNSHALAEQLSAHSTVKSGYRFNLSKDISISAVDGGGPEQIDDYDTGGQLLGANIRVKRTNPLTGAQRGVPPALPIGVAGSVRPRVQTNSSILNGQQQQRIFTGAQLRQLVRTARPQHILNPRTGQTVRIAGVAAGNRPVSMLTVRSQQQHQLGQKSAKDSSSTVDSSTLVNAVPGPITLPGGNITVTPLSLMNAGVPLASFDGANTTATQNAQHVAIALKTNASSSATNLGIINVQQQSSGGTTIVNNAATGGVKPLKAGITPQQRRNLMANIPPSVSMHVQNLTKTMGDLIKSTVEQITLEVIDWCNSNNTQGKAEASRLQVEIDRLQNKLKQEVTDVKHNNDIALRELRITMENDKKRALAELKRQLDGDRQKAIEETKKKQWCASCGREALFYCCWNTSYCGYQCQEEHWPTHMASCSQSSTNSR